MKCYAIIPSGGLGKRMNNPLPKQYMQFHGKELIAYTIDVFQKSNQIDSIIVAAQKEFFLLLNEIKQKYSLTKIESIIEGGIERQHSVFNALKSIQCNENDIIVVHDAVRPLLSQEILSKSIDTAMQFGSAVVAIKARDTLINGTDSVLSYVDRSEMFHAQTPQVFRYGILMDAMNKAEKENFIGTDESMLVHRAGYKVKIVEGSSINFKITNQDDIKLFELLTRNK
ncbi:MAG: 2-C-methyl-D-erythritol 4-phosphate cytidylyltransferase [Bacteroidota bacterium]